MLHGTTGIHDGVAGMFDHFLEKGYGVICPSRPGYARSPHADSYDDCADRLAALVDALDITSLPIYGISGGGAPAIAFARRHPEKTQCLLLECAITGNYKHPKIAGLNNWFLKQALGSPATVRISEMVGMETLITEAMKEESLYNAE